MPATAVSTNAASIIISSRSLRRTLGPTTLPIRVPIALALSTTPKKAVDAPSSRSQKAMRKVRKPADERRMVIADAAMTMLVACSSAVSSAVALRRAIVALGSWRAEMAASTK